MTASIKPILLTTATILPPTFIMAELTSEEGKWLLYGLGALAFLAFLVKNVLGSAREYKALKQGGIKEPFPVVIEKSLAEKFVNLPTFQTFEKYVHDSHHKIANDINGVQLSGQTRGKEMEDLLRQLNDKNEKRSGDIFGAIQKEGRRLDERVNDVLKEVSKVAGAFEQSQRRRIS